jgi:acetylglutamate kinase
MRPPVMEKLTNLLNLPNLPNVIDKQALIDKAKVLIEALPYISKFRGRTIVIKYGGHAMDDLALRETFALDVILMKYVGISPVIVHGGGPQIAQMLERLGIKSQFVAGQRVTDDATMDVVEMVLGGTVNKEIVRIINRAGGRAVGISGKDGKLVRARKIPFLERRSGAPGAAPELVDPGRVGEVESVAPEILEKLVAADFVPVIAPIGSDADGVTLNINADPFAAKIASALRAEKLVLLTDVDGVRDAKGSLLTSLTAAQAGELVGTGAIGGGMIPKVACGLEALREGVRKVHIVDGRLEHAMLLEIFTDHGIGTELVMG